MANKTSAKSTAPRAKKRVVAKSQPRQAPIESEIATAAYYKAEHRGFVPGRELEDWLEAEQEVRTRR